MSFLIYFIKAIIIILNNHLIIYFIYFKIKSHNFSRFHFINITWVVEKLLKRLITSIEFYSHILFPRNYSFILIGNSTLIRRNVAIEKLLQFPFTFSIISWKYFVQVFFYRASKINCNTLEANSLKFNFIILFNFLSNLYKTLM